MERRFFILLAAWELGDTSVVYLYVKKRKTCLKVSSGIFQRENYLLAPCKVMAIVKQ